MFTGIIESLGKVKSIQKSESEKDFVLKISPENKKYFDDVKLGESIAVNGVCLTVASMDSQDYTFYVSPETLERTQFKSLHEQELVNLERALKVSDRLSGHIVQGHVDGIGTLVGIKKNADSVHLKFKIPESLSKYCIEKGSICINGVSLTINTIFDHVINVMIIPHTWEHTQFIELKMNDLVNIEVDVLAKYVEKLCQK